MFDDDLFNFYNSYNGSSTETETEPEKTQTQTSIDQNFGQTTSYNPYLNSNGYDSDYDDDYSVTPNYNEEKSYDSNTDYETYSSNEQETEVKRYRKMSMPVIEKSEETVTLTKMRTRIELQPRMKIAVSVFAIIVLSLAFVIIWNVVSISRLNSVIAQKQQTVNELTSSISSLQNEYTLLGDEENLLNMVENAGFVVSDETNTFVVSAGEMFQQSEIEDLPSNWFNNVCDFLSKLFS